MQNALSEARDRLRAALLAGEDSGPHRSAIELLESAERARQLEAQALIDTVRAESDAQVAARADALLAGARADLDCLISSLTPVPAGLPTPENV